ncbi:MAG TPA: 5-methylcytosine-specific restriction endonuclease system specificity protein McrC [Myxococcota bacterium]|nr:5-methylcytosine-specific restriction endonuclease system specificity protein McrC [Myxococcota bacterium]HND32104.1 5-methylcytosine-specific restriction endonuclease system specificity protein McrC [Myxococcota bacterium]
MVTAPHEVGGFVGRVPVRNLWLLMLYASDFYRTLGSRRVEVEECPEDLPDLVASILADCVEKRLRRRLGAGYQPRHAVLNRARGRIDMLTTETHGLLAQGRVACFFEGTTVDRPRNRLVRAALERVAGRVRSVAVERRCRSLAGRMAEEGVLSGLPTLAELRADPLGRNDVEDQPMVAAAMLALELAIPTEIAGDQLLPMPEREDRWVRRLFEKAVGGFFRVTLECEGWRVQTATYLHWPVEAASEGMSAILPRMQTDIVLERPTPAQRIVIDTKFNALLTTGWYRDQSIRSGYLYQIYAYLRTQVGRGDPLADRARGLLLHPAVGGHIVEEVQLHGHRIRFATVDLTASARELRRQLLASVEDPASALR